VSRVIAFNRKYFRCSVNIQDCFSLERKTILAAIVTTRTWAVGLHRLLAERRGLKKGDLAEMAGVRPALISAVANSSTPPEISSLQRIASGFTKFDRKHDPLAPDVELWEFFVTDEQAAILRERAIKNRQQSNNDDVMARAMEIFAASFKQATAEQHAPPVTRPAPVQPQPQHPRKKRA
jgi:transcriptional regulator with XRE-family HTH domain